MNMKYEHVFIMDKKNQPGYSSRNRDIQFFFGKSTFGSSGKCNIFLKQFQLEFEILPTLARSKNVEMKMIQMSKGRNVENDSFWK